MALINRSDQQVSSSKRRFKPVMLRDYLLDDLGSSSSSGFKSFPRRQCCADSVRLILEKSSNDKRRLNRNRSTCGAAFGFAAKRASTAFVNAVKLLPFPSSAKSQSVRNGGKRKGSPSRSFSRNLLKRSFWRNSDRRLCGREDTSGRGSRIKGADDLDQKQDGQDEIVRQKESNNRDRDLNHEIRRWNTFAELLQERTSLDHRPSSVEIMITTTTVTTPCDAETNVTPSEISGTESGSSSSMTITISENSGNSFDGSEFFTNSDVLHSSMTSGDSEISSQNDAAEEETTSWEESKTEKESVGGVDGCADNRKEWSNDEKEQFSPVSVLDCLFGDEQEDEDEDEDMEGSPERVLQKTRRYGSFTRLQPLDLEKRIESFSENNLETSTNDEPNQAEDLLTEIKRRIVQPNDFIASSEADNLLLDFFDADIERGTHTSNLLRIAEEWANGAPEELFLGWEVKEKRGVYVREMERIQRWGDREMEKEDLVQELENDFFTDLVDGLMLDLLD